MNIYYFFAIIFLALSALFGYLGSIKSSDKQLDEISKEFKNLGKQIDNLNSGEITGSEISVIEEKYKVLAEDYMKALPTEAQSLQVTKEEKKLKLITVSIKYSEQLNYIREVAKGLTSAFNKNGANIKYIDSMPPSNLFSDHSFQLKISASDSEYWSIHLVDKNPENIGIMFVRMTTDKDGQHYRLTNDSIVFRWISPDKFGFSLNGSMSDEARQKVASGLSKNVQPIGLAHEQLETLVQNIIKYTLAKEQTKNI